MRSWSLILMLPLLLASLAGAGEASAQSGTPSTQTPADPPANSGSLPVSLDRIREGLSQPGLQLQTEIPPDFRIAILEQQKLDDMLSKIDFSGGPVPAGGLYAYEQQRRLFDPVRRPLMQPYAAYNGGQLITVALENLLAQYLGRPLLDAAAGAARARDEQAAKEEVAQAIAAYCARRPDRDAIEICTQTPAR
jgi:hypothetical protein